MRSKKAIELSLTTVLGLAVAAIVLLFIVVPLLTSIYNFYVKHPDYETEQGFKRLVNAIQNVKEGETIVVPVQGSKNFKITTHGEDPSCVSRCLCLCNAEGNTIKTGCSVDIHDKKCFKEDLGEFSIKGPKVSFIEVVGEKEKISFKGDVIGNCDWRGISECSGVGCRVKVDLTNFEPVGHIDFSTYRKCTSCRNDLGCSQYAEVESARSNAAIIGTTTPYEVSCGLYPASGECLRSYYADLKDQCFKNDCGVASGCSWEEEKRRNYDSPTEDLYGQCKSCSDLECDKVPLDACNTACDGKCKLDTTANKCVNAAP